MKGNKPPESQSEFTAFGFLLEYQNLGTTDSKQGNRKLTAQKCYFYYFLFNLFILIIIIIIIIITITIIIIILFLLSNYLIN